MNESRETCRRAFQDALAAVGRIRAEAWALPECPERSSALALADSMEGAAFELAAKWGFTVTRPVVFAPPGETGGRLQVELRVVARLSGAHAEITRQQHARLLEIEGRHQGAIPVTAEESAALQDGKPERLAALARSPDSNLHPLFV